MSTRSPATRWPTATALTLAMFNGAWMVYDGARALTLGDYVTPSSGAAAGQLGPWAGALATVGLDPRATMIKAAFVVYGLVLIATAVVFLVGRGRARKTLAAVAAAGLWYLPFGTIINLALMAALLRPTPSRSPTPGSGS
jgi:hypothetical protein